VPPGTARVAAGETARGRARAFRRALGLGLGVLWLAAAGAPGIALGEAPGAFDHYVLSLSWSPQYCASPQARSEPLQCEYRRYGFVVHGLWPQHGPSSPAYCATREPREVRSEIVQQILDIMPSERLINHQWSKHGTCSGLGQERYFAAARKAFESLSMPSDVERGRLIYTDRRSLLAAIQKENPGLPANAVVLRCSSSDFSEMRVCLSRDFQPIPCKGGSRGNCPASGIRIRPIR